MTELVGCLLPVSSRTKLVSRLLWSDGGAGKGREGVRDHVMRDASHLPVCPQSKEICTYFILFFLRKSRVEYSGEWEEKEGESFAFYLDSIITEWRCGGVVACAC